MAGRIFVRRKEAKTMNYWKPEVSTLGAAAEVIERIGPAKSTTPSDNQPGSFIIVNPAYDLDE